MKVNTNPIRGTYDYAPKQAELRETVRQKILKCYQQNGFSLITTPILENLQLLNSSDGGDNLRLMFKTIKRGEKLDLKKPDLTENDITEEGLRYDLTVPLARFYANNKEQLPSPFKAIQIDYSFRAERPQKGRDRQFIQCDIDEFGDASVEAEIDVLSTGLSAYTSLGFKDLTIKINSKEILNQITEYFGYAVDEISSVCISLDKFDKIGFDGVLEELKNKFPDDRADKLVEAIQSVKQNGLNSLAKFGVKEECVNRLQTILDTMNGLYQSTDFDYKFVYDITIVRGQGYYTGVVYEVYCPDFRGAIGAGGRYDKMIEKLIGMTVPAVGFSIGFAPVCMLLEEKNAQFEQLDKLALIYNDGEFDKAFAKKQELMKDFKVSLYKRPKNFKALLEKLKYVGFSKFAFLDQEINIKDI